MSDTQPRPWLDPITDLKDFQDGAARLEHPFADFPRTEGRLHAVLGGAKMGKTSLLNVLPAWLLQEPVRHGQHLAPTPIEYDQTNLESPQAFLLRVVKRLREGLRERGLCTISERNFEPYFEGRPPVEGFREALTFLLEQARQASLPDGRALRDVRLVGLIDNADEVARLPWAAELFRDLRDLYARVELVRRSLDLVLAGEDALAGYFASGAPWADGGRVSLGPLTSQTVSTWLQDASGVQLSAPWVQTMALESGGHPFPMRYFVHEICRLAERRGWDGLPPNVMERLTGSFIQQYQTVLTGWARSLRPAGSDKMTWATYRLLAEAGDAGLDINTVEDKLWDELGTLVGDVDQTLEKLMWHGVILPLPDKRFIASGVFRRYCQQQPPPEPEPPPATQPVSKAVVFRPPPPALEYADFVLRLSKQTDHYQVRVESALGETSGEFRNPFSPSEQAAMWQAMTQPAGARDAIRASARSTVVSREAEDIGGQLFRAIFQGELLALFRSAWNDASTKRLGLRVKLIMDMGIETLELHSLPWELLYDKDGPLDFLALSKNIPLVRYVDLAARIPNFRQVDQLRLLVVMAHPADYPGLSLEREAENMRAALEELRAQGRLEYRIVQGRDANMNNLQQIFLDEDYHVFHFMGHGGFKDGQGFLLLEGADGHGEPLEARRLMMLLRDEPDIRLVFLNACQTAQAIDSSPFASVAGALVKSGVPGVVATQYTISDKAAINFARMFYQALATHGNPLEAAVAEGRRAVALVEKNCEWGVPVLYLRAQDGRVFQ